MKNTNIEWTDETWNPLRGCSKVSEGCRNCYAETMAKRFSGEGQPYEGTIKNGKWSGEIRLVPEKLIEPLKWREPRKAFVNSMSDLFHRNVPFEYIAAVQGIERIAAARKVSEQQISGAQLFDRERFGIGAGGL